MTSSYEDIYSRFFLRVKDYDIQGLEENLVNEILEGYLRATISQPMVRRLFSSITIDADITPEPEDGEEVLKPIVGLEYELRDSWDDDSDKEFVDELLAVGMVAQWASPKYHSTLLTNQFFSDSEQKFYSQNGQLTALEQLYKKSQTDMRKLIRDRGYNLSVVNGVK